MCATNVHRRFAPAALVALGMVCATPASADDYAVDWFSIDGGGALLSAGGAYQVSGTVGQPEARSSLQPLAGGPFELVGGFWSRSSESTPCVGDTNADGVVDLTDLATLLANFGTPTGATPAQGDSDSDGDVDLGDLAA